MARKNFDSTDYLKHMNYAWPTVGIFSPTNNTVTYAVVLATIEATDAVICTPIGMGATNAYVLKAVVTAGTGFTITMSEACISATISYAVFKTNS